MINSQALTKGKGMTRRIDDAARLQDAEAVAAAALGFIASDAERLGRFLAATGLGPHNLRSAAAEPGFHAGVLDHVASDETLLLAFAADAGTSPERVMSARDALAGPPPDGDF
jgi:hypothetical protein